MKRIHIAIAVAALLTFAGPLGCSKKSETKEKAPVASKASTDTKTTPPAAQTPAVAQPIASAATGESDVQTKGKILALQFHSDF